MGRSSVRHAAQAYMIPRSTIQRHVTDQMNPPPPPQTNPSQLSHNSVLNKRQEEDLVNYIIWMSSHGFPIDTSVVAQLAVEIVAMDGRSWAAEYRIRWAQRFVKRHDIASRCPNYVTNSAAEIPQDIVNHYFQLLYTTLRDLDLLNRPSCILNMDETGWARGQQFKLRGLFKRGIKHPFQKKGISLDHITTVHTGTAPGELLAPMLIYKKSVPQNIDNYPSGYAISHTESGFMNQALFLAWLQCVVVPWMSRKTFTNILLIIDNGRCHLGIEGLQYAKKHNITLFALPPNCTGFLQPFDQLFFSLKCKFYSLAANIKRFFTDSVINKSKFVFGLKQSLLQLWSQEKVQKAFKITGIYPFNPRAIRTDLIPNYDPAKVYTPSTPDSAPKDLVQASADDSDVPVHHVLNAVVTQHAQLVAYTTMQLTRKVWSMVPHQLRLCIYHTRTITKHRRKKSIIHHWQEI